MNKQDTSESEANRQLIPPFKLGAIGKKSNSFNNKNSKMKSILEVGNSPPSASTRELDFDALLVLEKEKFASEEAEIMRVKVRQLEEE